MQNALEAHKRLYFDFDDIVANISLLVQNIDNPLSSLSTIGSITNNYKKRIKEAEHASKLAYIQLIHKNQPEKKDVIEIQGVLEWKPSLLVNAHDILNTERKLGELLNSILKNDFSTIQTKLRESCSLLLKLGVKLPVEKIENDDFLSKEQQKMIISQVKQTGKHFVKEVFNKIISERNNLMYEKETAIKEIDFKNQEINSLISGIEVAKVQFENREKEFYSKLQVGLFNPWSNLWGVYENLETGSSPVQLASVFKLIAPTIQHFIEKINR